MTYEEFKEKVGSVILTGEGNCPVTPVVQMLQGKWKLQILYELCIKCPMRFGELKKVLKPITNTALTNALKELEADGFIQRVQFNEIPPHVEYSFTEKGRDLMPVFYQIMVWGFKHENDGEKGNGGG
jgi:DNA-binding HxlR family transcriptional regulator